MSYELSMINVQTNYELKCNCMYIFVTFMDYCKRNENAQINKQICFPRIGQRA